MNRLDTDRFTLLNGTTMLKRLLLCLLFATGVTTLWAQQDQTITISSGGIQRMFDIHLPALPVPADLPVVLCYHGTGGTGAGMRGVSDFDGLSDPNRFIVVYPQGVRIGNDVQWNVYVDDKPGHGGIDVADAPDDVQFTRDIIDYLATNYNVDRGRVYATGLSNGGFMCYALSMLAANEIKAIAPVAASLWADNGYLTQLVTSGTVMPIPVMHVHGTADNIVDYPDPDNVPKDYEEYPLFIPSRACGSVTYSQVVPIMSGVDKLVFCGPPTEVSLIRIQGMGHAWTNGAYPTSLEILKFFGLTGATGDVATDANQRTSRLALMDGDAAIRFRTETVARVEVSSLTGATVYSANHDAGIVSIPRDRFPSGLYFVRVYHAHGDPTVQGTVILQR